VTLSSLLRAWHEFFFKPQRPTPVALFRIVYGALMLINLLMLRPEWLMWYGPHGVLPVDAMHRITVGPRIDLLLLFPQTDAVITAFFWVSVLVTASLMIGFMTRFSAVATYLCFSSICERNYLILNGGDSILRVMGFFLMFAPAGAALSVDRLARIWRGQESTDAQLRAPWAQRMMQIQTSIIYIATFWWKTLGVSWLNGTAVYYVMRVEAYRRFPVPGIDNTWVVKLATWGTLAVEFAAGVLVWFRDLRYFVLLAALGLHLSIEYAMNLPLFEWIMISTFVLFIYPEDLSRAWAWVRDRVAPRLGAPATVLYDGASARSVHAANVLRAIDVFEKLRLVDVHSAEAKLIFPELAEPPGQSRVLVKTSSGLQGGAAGVCAIAPLIPLLWSLVPLALLQRHARQVSGAATPAR